MHQPECPLLDNYVWFDMLCLRAAIIQDAFPAAGGAFCSCFEWVWSTLNPAFALHVPLIYPLVSLRFHWGSTCNPGWKWLRFDGLHAEDDPAWLLFFVFCFSIRWNERQALWPVRSDVSEDNWGKAGCSYPHCFRASGWDWNRCLVSSLVI